MNVKKILHIADNAESILCQCILSFFVVILFLQIMLRMCFNYVIPWSEEVSRFTFVWFVFLGAAYAARLNAHNRVLIQFKLFPPVVQSVLTLFADIIWIGFNIVMVVKSVEVIQQLTKFTYYSPALGISMAYVYWIFPISFTLMSIRIIQVNYIKYILKEEIADVDKVDINEHTSLTDAKEQGV